MSCNGNCHIQIKELEAEVKVLRKRQIPMWVVYTLVVVDLITFIFAGVIAVNQQNQINENHKIAAEATLAAQRARNQNDTLRQGLILGCQKNGNPIRSALRNDARTQLQQTNPVLYAQILPNLSSTELHGLIHQQVQTLKGQIKEFHPIDCKALYGK